MAGSKKKRVSSSEPLALPKAPTGIHGLDEITGGGLPRGRPTLVCGAAGCGKTLLAMEFLVRGAREHGEPGVFMSFEETARDLAENVRSLGFDLDELCRKKLLRIDHVRIERSEIREAGEYDLEGLFVRLNHAIDSIKAKRVVLDTIEALFAGFDNEAVLRAELRRLFRWLKDKGVTAIVTGERGTVTLSRNGLEEYVSDCVILLDHRVDDQVSTRRLRIVKYRGSLHGTNEYPFLIDEQGISVMPITSVGLLHEVSTERVSSGIARLDAMLGGEGYFRGSTVLVTGTAGTGKTTLSASFAQASCQRGERCLYFAFEESPGQLVRNMGSVGIDLRGSIDKGLLRIEASRPTSYGLETHLAMVHKAVRQFAPRVVVMDPITTLSSAGMVRDSYAVLTRLVDYMKSQRITLMMTSLTAGGEDLEQSGAGITSLVDTWLLVRDIELGGERNRGLYVLKSRGMPHSNQIREFVIRSHGLDLLDVYRGPGGVLTGSMRLEQEAREQSDLVARQRTREARARDRERQRALLEARIDALRSEFEADEREASLLEREDSGREAAIAAQREATALRRSAEVVRRRAGGGRKGKP
ncbi:MAG TPA: circadian clock protein KaiC [Burkholderiaceae bacterium]